MNINFFEIKYLPKDYTIEININYLYDVLKEESTKENASLSAHIFSILEKAFLLDSKNYGTAKYIPISVGQLLTITYNSNIDIAKISIKPHNATTAEICNQIRETLLAKLSSNAYIPKELIKKITSREMTYTKVLEIANNFSDDIKEMILLLFGISAKCYLYKKIAELTFQVEEKDDKITAELMNLKK